MEGAAGLAEASGVSVAGVGDELVAQVVEVPAAHGSGVVEVVVPGVVEASGPYRERRLRDGAARERAGDTQVVRLVEQGQETVVLAGLLPVPVGHHGGDTHALVDDPVVQLRHPHAQRGGGVPAGEQLVAQVHHGLLLARGHSLGLAPDLVPVVGPSLPE